MIESGYEDHSGLTCLKFFVLGFNIIFMMVGILLVSIGSTVYGVYFYFNEFLENQFFSPASLLIFTGCLIFVVSAIGFIAVVKESTLMINTYCILLCFTCILQVSAGISAVVLKGKVESTLYTNMKSSFQNYLFDIDAQESITFTQRTLQCCGIYDPSDWKNIFLFGNYQYMFQEMVLPKSCCADFIDNGEDFLCFRTNLNGCLPKLKILIYQTLRILFGSSLALAIIQLTGITFSHRLARVLIKVKSERLARELLMRNQMQNIYDMMGAQGRNYKSDNPPSYDEIINSHK